jgi:hypothetical protein
MPKAAAQLGLSQSAISQMFAEMERWFGWRAEGMPIRYCSASAQSLPDL